MASARRTTLSIAAGISAISDVRGAFAQNHKTLARYYQAIDRGTFPIERGYALTLDDRVRRFVITELMCNFHIARRDVEERFGINFGAYFAKELTRLSAADGPVGDGLLEIDNSGLTVTPRGRLFVRNVCMAFDRYLTAHEGTPTFSRTI